MGTADGPAKSKTNSAKVNKMKFKHEEVKHEEDVPEWKLHRKAVTQQWEVERKELFPAKGMARLCADLMASAPVSLQSLVHQALNDTLVIEAAHHHMAMVRKKVNGKVLTHFERKMNLKLLELQDSLHDHQLRASIIQEHVPMPAWDCDLVNLCVGPAALANQIKVLASKAARSSNAEDRVQAAATLVEAKAKKDGLGSMHSPSDDDDWVILCMMIGSSCASVLRRDRPLFVQLMYCPRSCVL